MDVLEKRGQFQIYLSGRVREEAFITWLVFHIAGSHVFLPLLVATFSLSRRARRHPTLINMCITWIIASVLSLLLFYTNEFSNAPRASQTPLCLAQAAVIFAVPPMVALSAFGVIYHVWFVVHASVGNGPSMNTWRTSTLVVLPYVAFLGFALAGVFLVQAHPENVSLERRVLYCSVFNNIYTNTISVVTAASLLATLMLEVHIMIVLRRNWVGLRNAGYEKEGSVDLQLIARVVIFGIYVTVGFAVSVLAVFVSSIAVDLYLSTVPVVIFLVFGLSPDLFRVWACRPDPNKKRRSPSELKISSPIASVSSTTGMLEAV